MTTPQERTRSILRTREFLFKLLDPKKTPHTPRYVRDEARRLSRHFPAPEEICLLAQNDGQWLDAGTAAHYVAKHPLP